MEVRYRQPHLQGWHNSLRHCSLLHRLHLILGCMKSIQVQKQYVLSSVILVSWWLLKPILDYYDKKLIFFSLVNATAVIESSSITINETAPITITCIATGVPAPNITWTFNNQTSNLQQTVMHTEVSVSTNGHVTLGRTMSTLHLDRPVFPIHHGLYTCTGRNRYDSISSISAASAFVDIHGN